MAPKIVAGVVFALVYLWLIVSKYHRAKATWVGVLSIFLAGAFLPEPIMSLGTPFQFSEKGWSAVNWNVIGIFCGTFLIAEAFIYSKVPTVISDFVVTKCPNVCWAVLAVCGMASFLSVFICNVATVMITAPIAFEVARRTRVNPVPFIIALALCANLQGTATLIGDTPSMLLAAEFRFGFNDFIWYQGKPSIFFVIQVGAVFSAPVLWLVYRRQAQPVPPFEVERARGYFPLATLSLMILGLATANFLDPPFLWLAGTECMVLGALRVLWVRRREQEEAKQLLRGFDFSTAFFLIGIFLIIWALEDVGLIKDLADLITGLTGHYVLRQFFVLLAFSVIVSAFVDNVPYLAIMLGVVRRMATDPATGEMNALLPFGLLVGTCLGGNITPIGASANLVAVGMLNKRDHVTSFLGFVKFGLPFTVAAVTGGALFLLIVWHWFK